ncbi:MAG: hypothetical protein FWB76_07355 [Oscillospiraceae bacterium]|nr:hypothetical protein [Oscillospiraceae bacterium]
MTLYTLAQQVIDFAATDHAIAYVRQDTRMDGSVFASFHFVDCETMQTRPISEGAYLQVKFGDLGPYLADGLAEPYACRSARLPGGGCAVLRSDAMLCLYEPDGSHGAEFFLGYRDAPAHDLAATNDGLWYTVPARNAIALFSLQRCEMVLRVGGSGVFNKPLGIAAYGERLLVSCIGSSLVRTLEMPGYDLKETIDIARPFENFFMVQGRRFVLSNGELFAVEVF